MRRILGVFLLCTFALTAQVSVGVGIQIGPPPPPRVLPARPVAPGPGYVWVDGYWYAVRGHWHWHSGYWTLVPFPGARWVSPRYEAGLFYDGYWQGEGHRFAHDHHWDHQHDRDKDRYHH